MDLNELRFSKQFPRFRQTAIGKYRYYTNGNLQFRTRQILSRPPTGVAGSNSF
jgi:hypothetical protein